MRKRAVSIALIVLVMASRPAAAMAAVGSGSEAMFARTVAMAQAYANSPMSAQSIGALATEANMSTPGFMGAVQRVAAGLKATGLKVLPYGSAAAAGSALHTLAGGIVLGVATHYGATAAAEWALGTVTYYNSSGVEWEGNPLENPYAEGYYAHYEGGAFGLLPWQNDSPEVDWMFAPIPPYGQVIDSLPAGCTVLKYGSVVFTVQQAHAFTFMYNRAVFFVPGYTPGFNWTTTGDLHQWSGLVVGSGVPSPTVTPMACWAQGTPRPTVWTVSGHGGVWWVTTATREWPNWETTGSGGNAGDAGGAVDLPMPPAGSTPDTFRVAPGITEDSTLAELGAATTVPNILPGGIPGSTLPGDNPGAGLGSTDASSTVLGWLGGFFPSLGTTLSNLLQTSPDYFKSEITPELAAIKVDAAGRWPFAGGAVVSSVTGAFTTASGSGSDPMEWYLDLTPPAVGGAEPGSAGVWIRPLTWLEPFAGYRWVFVALVAGGLIVGLYGLLKPKVAV